MAGIFYFGEKLGVALGSPRLSILVSELEQELQSYPEILDKILDFYNCDSSVDFSILSKAKYNICYNALVNIVKTIKSINDREKWWIVELWDNEMKREMQESPLYLNI
ncbi:hypothetical protein [Providencia sneebia]|uniref:Uncharacterized protein n=1 Tax=Providencia sneebia DSM 19967 TaxID=1141660 RepID=K8WBD5_9GAMM|nr:hypothetical protein [Providencia sneebia]EKT53555.1 hypothetical protein OO7_15124 [Providencia sneebia DSM 19967]